MATNKKSTASQKKKNSAISEIKLELTNGQKGDLLKAFNLLDVEGNGLVRIREVKVALRAIGFEPTASELRRLMAMYDKDNKGFLDYSSFLDIMTKKMTEKDTKDDLMKAFRIFDCEDSGCITFASLQKAAELLGEDITDEELQEMIDEADKTGNGQVNEQEFFRIIRKATII
ncbi:caltractin [Paragonimus heterotremus]|uniref:Caltractin n=1 Tax=Paragonimus heterotremus TaxID=100268 RepID=A0A8J4SQV2_9TREM|nr:caltractin [Paragonimus heterotremus]